MLLLSVLMLAVPWYYMLTLPGAPTPQPDMPDLPPLQMRRPHHIHTALDSDIPVRTGFACIADLKVSVSCILPVHLRVHVMCVWLYVCFVCVLRVCVLRVRIHVCLYLRMHVFM